MILQTKKPFPQKVKDSKDETEYAFETAYRILKRTGQFYDKGYKVEIISDKGYSTSLRDLDELTDKSKVEYKKYIISKFKARNAKVVDEFIKFIESL